MVSTLLQPLAESQQHLTAAQVNPTTRVLNGTLGAGILLRGHDGRRVNASGSTHYTLDVQNPTAPGRHAAFVLSGTPAAAAPTPANSVLLVTDAGLSVGAGTGLRLYSTDGTDYASLVPDADGGLQIGGSGANAGDVTTTGDLTAAGNLAWYSGGAAVVVLDHAATAARTVTYQDLSGTVALLGAQNAGHLLWVDNTYDIGAAGVTRPRDLYLARNAYVSGTLTVSGTSAFVGDITIAAGAWVDFAPTLSQGGAPTYTVPRARYRILGKTAHVEMLFAISAVGSATAANPFTVTLPAALTAQAAHGQMPRGVWYYLDFGVGFYVGMANMNTTTTVRGRTHTAADNFGVSPAVTAAANDQLGITMTYEIA